VPTVGAGRCSASAAVRDGRRLIAVACGTHSEQAGAAETPELLTYGFRFCETQTFYQTGTGRAQATVGKGTERQVKAGLAEDLSMTMPKGDMKKLSASMTMNPQLVAPLAKRDVIGKVEVKKDDQVVHTANLIALAAVEEGGICRRVWDSIRLFFYGLFNFSS
ncbi:D-alanyl-D-alanine carboxypeptidase, partial [Pseudomonas syringae]